MEINGIKNGIVLDHIRAGKSMEIYDYLNLSQYDFQVAMIQNVTSKKMGKKDILKIATNDIDINLDALGYISSGITVNKVVDNNIVEKSVLEFPEKLNGIIKCKNPRCITSTEQGLMQKFRLIDRENGIYRCMYCDMKTESKK